MTKLTIRRITSKNFDSAFRMLLYFNARWLFEKKRKATLTSINLSRLYGVVPRRHAWIVKLIANIWFQRETRGDHRSKQVSTWRVREHPRLNNQLRRILMEHSEAHREVKEEMWRIASEKNSVSVIVTTKITFDTEAEAALFIVLADAITKGDEDV